MNVKVTAGSRREGVWVKDGVLSVKVSAPAEGGKANKRVVELLEKEFGGKVTIIRGSRSREKEIIVSGPPGRAEEKMSERRKKEV